MNRRNILIGSLFSCINFVVYAWGSQNLWSTSHQNNTNKKEISIVEYVIEQEEKLASLSTDCQEVLQHITRMDQDENGNIINVHYAYDSIWEKFKFEDQLKRCWKQLQELKKTEKLIEPKIIAMMKQGQDINAIDSTGRKPLEYCQSRIFYDILRNNGADFQWNMWAYIHPEQMITAGVGAGFMVYLLTNLLTSMYQPFTDEKDFKVVFEPEPTDHYPVTDLATLRAKFKESNCSTMSNMPTMIIKHIENNTPCRLAIIDRIHNFKQIAILQPGEHLQDMNLMIEDSRNIIFSGSLQDVLSSYGQYLIIQLNDRDEMLLDRECYLNFAMTPGGLNDGSNIVSGPVGSQVLKFMMASIHGGCVFSAGPLKKSQCDVVNITITLSKKSLRDDKEGNKFILGTNCLIVPE